MREKMFFSIPIETLASRTATPSRSPFSLLMPQKRKPITAMQTNSSPRNEKKLFR